MNVTLNKRLQYRDRIIDGEWAPLSGSTPNIWRAGAKWARREKIVRKVRVAISDLSVVDVPYFITRPDRVMCWCEELGEWRVWCADVKSINQKIDVLLLLCLHSSCRQASPSHLSKRSFSCVTIRVSFTSLSFSTSSFFSSSSSLLWNVLRRSLFWREVFNKIVYSIARVWEQYVCRSKWGVERRVGDVSRSGLSWLSFISTSLSITVSNIVGCCYWCCVYVC